MSARTEVVPYHWNRLDAISTHFRSLVTPYRLPAHLLNDAAMWVDGSVVELPLALSTDPATVGRFFRTGYEWVDVPKEVKASRLFDLFGELYKLDKRRFAHFDPLLMAATCAARDAAAIRAKIGGTMIPNDPALTPNPALLPAHYAIVAQRQFDTTLVPFEDLARLHFEYWGNSRFRREILNPLVRAPGQLPPWDLDIAGLGSRAPILTSLFTDEIMDSVLQMIPPQTLPTSKNGVPIEKVLARAPLEGVPIRCAAVPKGAATHVVPVTTLEPPRIELDGWSPQTLVPFYLNDWTTRVSNLRFRITIPISAQQTLIEIVNGRDVIYSETHVGGEYFVPGTHLWTWDGYDQDGVFDTRVLRSTELGARLTTTDTAGRSAVATTEIATGPGKIRWLDVRVDSRTSEIEVTAYLHFIKPSDIQLASFKMPLPLGLGGMMSETLAPLGSSQGLSLLPAVPGAIRAMDPQLPSLIPEGGMPNIPGSHGWVPKADVFRGNYFSLAMNFPDYFDLDPATYEILKNDVMHGIGEHWSREVRVDGRSWVLRVSAQERGDDGFMMILANNAPAVLGSGAIDSVNLATFAEGLPIIYEWDPSGPEARRNTGAHEFGHSILREVYSEVFSLTHKGSSTIGQKPSAAALTYPTVVDPNAPTPGEYGDVMYYYTTGPNTEEQNARAKGAEDDARGLVWMCKIVGG